MNIESITFNTAETKIIVAYDDGTSREYGDADMNQYLVDHPERASDVVVIRGIVPPSRDDQINVARDQIKAERDRRKAGGVQVGDYWFHSDDASRIQQIGLVMMGANIPAGLRWKTMTGEFVTMTQELAGQIFNAVATADQEIFAVAEQHRIAMEASEIPKAYDFSNGWPLIYGEK